jgi:hypothetical protein
LSTACVSYGAEMSACAIGTLLEQHVFAVHAVVPSLVYPVAVVITGFLASTLFAVIAYVGSAAESLATSERFNVACVMTAPEGSPDKSNFIRIAFATSLSGHVYVVSCVSVL